MGMAFWGVCTFGILSFAGMVCACVGYSRKAKRLRRLNFRESIAPRFVCVVDRMGDGGGSGEKGKWGVRVWSLADPLDERVVLETPEGKGFVWRYDAEKMVEELDEGKIILHEG